MVSNTAKQSEGLQMEKLEEVERLIAELDPAGVQTSPNQRAKVDYGGFQLPAEFVWFCGRLKEPNGWPNVSTWPGLFSPFGNPSELAKQNDERRRGGGWAPHLVAFFGTDDGVYCFDFGKGDGVQIVSVDDWTNPREEAILAEFAAGGFAPWLRDIMRFNSKA